MIKSLTKREKTLLVIFAIVILVLGWYKLFYEPLKEDISALEVQTASEEAENTTNMAQVIKLRDMKAEIEEMKNDPDVKPTPLYDNSKELMIALNEVMMQSSEYSLTFDSAEQESFIVYRTISMEFVGKTYEEARRIVGKLNSDTFANQIEDINVSADEESTTVTMEITFFEVVA